MKEFGKTIYAYTREQAIQDGVLNDVTNTSEAKEAGFKIPICLTVGVQALCEVPVGLEGIQDYKGRLWDTLWMAVNAYRRWKSNPDDNDGRILPYAVIYQTGKNRKITKDLWLVFNEREGFTVMLPEEY